MATWWQKRSNRTKDFLTQLASQIITGILVLLIVQYGIVPSIINHFQRPNTGIFINELTPPQYNQTTSGVQIGPIVSYDFICYADGNCTKRIIAMELLPTIKECVKLTQNFIPQNSLYFLTIENKGNVISEKLSLTCKVEPGVILNQTTSSSKVELINGGETAKEVSYNIDELSPGPTYTICLLFTGKNINCTAFSSNEHIAPILRQFSDYSEISTRVIEENFTK